MDLGGLSWASLTIVGVIILAIVLAYGLLRNRAERPSAADTEAATRRVYDEEDEAHRGESDGVP